MIFFKDILYLSVVVTDHTLTALSTRDGLELKPVLHMPNVQFQNLTSQLCNLGPRLQYVHIEGCDGPKINFPECFSHYHSLMLPVVSHIYNPVAAVPLYFPHSLAEPSKAPSPHLKNLSSTEAAKDSFFSATGVVTAISCSTADSQRLLCPNHCRFTPQAVRK